MMNLTKHGTATIIEFPWSIALNRRVADFKQLRLVSSCKSDQTLATAFSSRQSAAIQSGRTMLFHRGRVLQFRVVGHCYFIEAECCNSEW